MSKNSRKISAFISLILITILSITPAYASVNKDMLKQAKKTKTKTRYVIVTDYSAHRTKVYDKKQKYKVIYSGKSCGAKKQKFGQFYLTGKKKAKRNGKEHKVNGKPVYYENWVSYLNNGAAIHGYLYRIDNGQRYHNTVDKIQDSKNLYKHNWSAGCTRADSCVAKFVWDSCGKNTGYYIME